MTDTLDAIVYVGVHDEVDVPEGYFSARRDTPVKVGFGPDECPEDLAWRLLEQRENWAKAPTAPAKKDGNK